MSDLISRQALCKYALNQKDKAITPNDIMRFPSADRPTGHIVTSGIYPTVWAECSECGTPIDAWDKFCRHCGVKMEVEK